MQRPLLSLYLAPLGQLFALSAFPPVSLSSTANAGGVAKAIARMVALNSTVIKARATRSLFMRTLRMGSTVGAELGPTRRSAPRIATTARVCGIAASSLAQGLLPVAEQRRQEIAQHRARSGLDFHRHSHAG